MSGVSLFCSLRVIAAVASSVATSEQKQRNDSCIDSMSATNGMHGVWNGRFAPKLGNLY